MVLRPSLAVRIRFAIAALCSSVYSLFVRYGFLPKRKGNRAQRVFSQRVISFICPQQQSRHLARIALTGLVNAFSATNFHHQSFNSAYLPPGAHVTVVCLLASQCRPCAHVTMVFPTNCASPVNLSVGHSLPTSKASSFAQIRPAKSRRATPRRCFSMAWYVSCMKDSLKAP